MVRGVTGAKLKEVILKHISQPQQQPQHKPSSSTSSSSTLENLVSDLEELMSAAQVVVIDFGLVQESGALEERAVDLYVLERAIMSTHPTLANASQVVLEGYCAQVRQLEAGLELAAAKAKEQGTGLGGRPNKQSANASAVMERLDAVRARGRKRSMLG